jgi:hypothetical protein
MAAKAYAASARLIVPASIRSTMESILPPRWLQRSISAQCL